MAATSATLNFDNQKNGVKGSLVHQHATHTHHCFIKALARRIHNIMQHGGSPDTPIYYSFHAYNQATPVSSDRINTTLEKAADTLGFFTPAIGYTKRDISSHSLRAGGARAMHLNEVPILAIMKIGRWKSQTS